MADRKRRGSQDQPADENSQSIFDLFEPAPGKESDSFGKIPVVRAEEEIDLTEGASQAEKKAAADVEAAGLQHWTAAPTGQIPAVLGSDDKAGLWGNVEGPSWQGDETKWSGPDLSDVFAETNSVDNSAGGINEPEEDGAYRTAKEPNRGVTPPAPVSRVTQDSIRQTERAERPASRNRIQTREAASPSTVRPEPRSVPGVRESVQSQAQPTQRRTGPVPKSRLSQRPGSDAPTNEIFSDEQRKIQPRPRQPTPPPRQATPSPRQPTPPPRQATPSPRQPTPPPRQATPSPRQPTPPPRQATPLPVQSTPSPTGRAQGPEQNPRSPDSNRPALSGESPIQTPRSALEGRPALEQGRVEQGRVEQGRVEQGRDEQGRDEQGRDEQGRDEQGRDDFDHQPLRQTGPIPRTLQEEDIESLNSGLGSEGSGRDLPKAIAVGVGLAIVVVGAIILGAQAMLALVSVVALLAVLELFNAMRLAGLRPATLLGTVGTVAIPAAAFYRGDAAFPLVTALIVVFSALWYLVGADFERPVLNMSLTLKGILWVGGLAGFAGLMLREEKGMELLAATVLITVASDTIAYVGGKSFGSKPLHHVSPNKTWEGTLSGFCAAVFVGLALGLTEVGSIWDTNVLAAVSLGAVVGIMAPIGDLAESLVKRDLGVKDMGTLLPGHGGVLDRVDGLLFALPGAYYLALIWQLFV